MDLSLNTALSWQTGTLIFRNRSLQEVKRELETQYGTEIPMYHWNQNTWFPDWHEPAPVNSRVLREIRLTLFLYYQEENDALMVRGIELGP